MREHQSYLQNLKKETPALKFLYITKCQLKSGIYGLKDIPELKEVRLGQETKVANFDGLRKEVFDHRNHPKLSMAQSWREHAIR